MESNRLLEMLPAYYRKIKEFRELTWTQAEELDLLQLNFTRIEDDMFILTSSEKAIERREKMFHILADKTVEDLPFRRQRLISRQTTNTPFTASFLRQQLELLSGGSDRVTMEVRTDVFELDIVTQISMRGGIEELWYLLEKIVPLNMKIYTRNELFQTGETQIHLVPGFGYSLVFELTSDFKADYDLPGDAKQGSALTGYASSTLSNDFKADYDLAGEAKHGNILTGYTTLELK